MSQSLKKKNKKLSVALLMGGVSSERQISLSTGKMIAKNLDKDKYIVRVYDTKKDLLKLSVDALKKKIDVAFIALHGKYGEDGTIQGLLELYGIAYTGCGVLASALAMNKQMAKNIMKENGFLVPPGVFLTKKDVSAAILAEIKSKIGFPCVVKPNDSGSSVGVTIVKSRKDFSRALKTAFKESGDILVEKYIQGREITVPVLGNDKLSALPVVEICPTEEFFNYKAKYTPGACDEIVPAEISAALAAKARNLAIKAYRALQCRGFARADMILRGKEIYILEVNTIPGMTPNSLLPKSAKAAGISFPKLLDKIIDLAKYTN